MFPRIPMLAAFFLSFFSRIALLAQQLAPTVAEKSAMRTIDSKGRIYFSDPRYGNRDSMEMRDHEGKLVEGVYRIDAPGKVTRVITHEVERPNGLLVSSDDKHLIVADNLNVNSATQFVTRLPERTSFIISSENTLS